MDLSLRTAAQHCGLCKLALLPRQLSNLLPSLQCAAAVDDLVGHYFRAMQASPDEPPSAAGQVGECSGHACPRLRWSGQGPRSVQCSRLGAGCWQGCMYLFQDHAQDNADQRGPVKCGVSCSTLLKTSVCHALPCCQCSLSAAVTTLSFRLAGNCCPCAAAPRAAAPAADHPV